MQKKTVLIVDDEVELAEITSIRLEQNGYDVQFAANGKEGYEKAIASRPDLILLDVLMPIMDGYETSRCLQRDERTRNIPVILFTAASETALGKKCIHAARDVVIKPFDSEDLLLKVHRLTTTTQ